MSSDPTEPSRVKAPQSELGGHTLYLFIRKSPYTGTPDLRKSHVENDDVKTSQNADLVLGGGILIR
ncbi:MAG: hypothetical protein EAZ76_05680 [Nostocales cyanobacterium]|nr:MAG: hypothetical protein EAZ87_08365 [Nostocales cyanobacterium]TAF17820.1 MAG: hypothetical protein EAZ76_05680 [Nostocales cyanobacterium]